MDGHLTSESPTHFFCFCLSFYLDSDTALFRMEHFHVQYVCLTSDIVTSFLWENFSTGLIFFFVLSHSSFSCWNGLHSFVLMIMFLCLFSIVLTFWMISVFIFSLLFFTLSKVNSFMLFHYFISCLTLLEQLYSMIKELFPFPQLMTM